MDGLRFAPNHNMHLVDIKGDRHYRSRKFPTLVEWLPHWLSIFWLGLSWWILWTGHAAGLLLFSFRLDELEVYFFWSAYDRSWSGRSGMVGLTVNLSQFIE